MAEVVVWHNDRCSKSRGALELLQERGTDLELRRYLDEPPTRAELETLLTQLRTDDPRDIIRTGEDAYRERGLETADREQLLVALVAEPQLLQRPIIVRGDRAVIGRPSERALELFD